MKTIFHILILITSAQLRSQDDSQNIDSLVTAYANIYRYNGTICVYQQGKTILEKGYGYQDIANRLPNTPNTIFQIGSLTKQFTATVILKLAEQNKLTLQDNLEMYFPNYPKGHEITIHQLLTHTSGIFEYFKNPLYHLAISDHALTKSERLSFFINEPMDFKSGGSFSYCNSGYELLGLIIEKITGKQYEQVVREMIIKPLHMVNTGFDFKNLKSDLKAKPYSLYSKHNVTEETPWDSTATFSAGSIYSNAKDLYLWHNGLLRNQIISKESLDKMYSPCLNGYGYASWIDSIYTKKVISHGGNVAGFTSHFIRVPEDDICIVLLNNTYNHEIEKIGNSILAILYNQPYKLLEEMTFTQMDLKKCEGEYEVNSKYHIKIEVVYSHLSVQINSDPKFEIYSDNANSFYSKDEDLRIKFKPDSNDVFSGIRIYKGLNSKSGVRIN